MALALTFVQSNNGKTLTITDASDGGTDLTGASIVITYSNVDYNITLTAWTVPGSESVEVTADDVGQTADTAFTDGSYKITYDATNETAVEYNIVLHYHVAYCVYNMLRLVPDVHACTDLCSNKEVDRSLFMFTFLKSLEYSGACGQVAIANTVLATLQNLCLNTGINECYSN